MENCKVILLFFSSLFSESYQINASQKWEISCIKIDHGMPGIRRSNIASKLTKIDNVCIIFWGTAMCWHQKIRWIVTYLAVLRSSLFYLFALSLSLFSLYSSSMQYALTYLSYPYVLLQWRFQWKGGPNRCINSNRL